MPAAAARTVLREAPGAGGHRVQGQLSTCPEHGAARARHLVPGRSDLGRRGVRAGPAPRVRLHAPGRWVDGALASCLRLSPAGLRRHLLAGRLLRGAGVRGRCPGPSQRPARGRVAGEDRARGCAARLGARAAPGARSTPAGARSAGRGQAGSRGSTPSPRGGEGRPSGAKSFRTRQRGGAVGGCPALQLSL